MTTRTLGTSTLILLALSVSNIAYAGTNDGNAAATADSYSTSIAQEPVEPIAPAKPEKLPVVQSSKPSKPTVRPFTHPAVAVKVGMAGVGFDVALPLARKFNIRGGASFFSYADTFTADGTNYNANLQFQSSNVSIDWFPFGGSFRMSPVLQIYNGNELTANTSVPAGQSFELGNQTYYGYKNGTNPVVGSAVFNLGNQGGSKVAPGFTIGWGNMIPRGVGQHWSVPFEIGFVYIQAPQMQLNLTGIGCTSQTDANNNGGPSCVNIATNTTAQANIQQEQVDINNTLSGLQFYPVLSIGLSYKF